MFDVKIEIFNVTGTELDQLLLLEKKLRAQGLRITLSFKRK